MNVCSDCNQTYRATAGHCRGGRYGGCCRSFRTSEDFDHHRTGRFDDGSRRCLTDAEMADLGWTRVDGHLWLSPQAAKGLERKARARAEGVAGDAGALVAVEVIQ